MGTNDTLACKCLPKSPHSGPSTPPHVLVSPAHILAGGGRRSRPYLGPSPEDSLQARHSSQGRRWARGWRRRRGPSVLRRPSPGVYFPFLEPRFILEQPNGLHLPSENSARSDLRPGQAGSLALSKGKVTPGPRSAAKSLSPDSALSSQAEGHSRE